MSDPMTVDSKRIFTAAGALKPWIGPTPEAAAVAVKMAIAVLQAVDELDSNVAAERDAYKAALDHAAHVLDEVVRYFDDGRRLPPAGFPLASVVRPARDAARSVLAGVVSTREKDK